MVLHEASADGGELVAREAEHEPGHVLGVPEQVPVGHGDQTVAFAPTILDHRTELVVAPRPEIRLSNKGFLLQLETYINKDGV